MRRFLVVVYILTIVLVALSHILLPEDVAIHFDGNGRADGWAPRWLNTALFMGLNTVLFAVCFFGPKLSLAVPKDLINLPNKEYWLADENLPRTREMLAQLLYEFGIAILAFFGVVSALTMQANFSEPMQLDMRLFTAAVVVFLVYTLAWCVRMFIAFRLPESGPIR